MRRTIGIIVLFAISSAHAETISTLPFWDGNSSVSPFGETNTATYGQTFSLNQSSSVDSFTFYLDDYNNGDFVDFEAYIYKWDDISKRITGSALFASSPLSTTNNGGLGGFEEFLINTGGINLSAGQYVAFFSASNLFDGLTGTSKWGRTTDGAYTGGTFVYSNNGSNFGLLSTNSWTTTYGADLAFTLETSVVPIPAAAWLFGSALVGLGWIRRKQTA